MKAAVITRFGEVPQYKDFPDPEQTDTQSLIKVKAAAIPPSVLTSLLPLKHSAQLQPGETVLINGATAVSGKIAVQVARLLGAGRIVATGRNKTSLKKVRDLGADEVIPLDQDDTTLAKCLKTAAGDNGYDIVVDFLWGRPAEILINTFIPEELGFPRHITRYLQIGEAAGSAVSLPASAFRTSGLRLMGIGKISWDTLGEELANTWQWLKKDKFEMDIEEVLLKDISSAWQRNDLAGKRLVLVP